MDSQITINSIQYWPNKNRIKTSSYPPQLDEFPNFPTNKLGISPTCWDVSGPGFGPPPTPKNCWLPQSVFTKQNPGRVYPAKKKLQRDTAWSSAKHSLQLLKKHNAPTAWWCNNHLEKYESQLGVGMIIPYIFWKKMFQTTNQIKIIPIDIIPLYKQYETQTTNQNLLQALFTESCQISFCAMLLNRDKSELPCQQKKTLVLAGRSISNQHGNYQEIGGVSFISL